MISGCEGVMVFFDGLTLRNDVTHKEEIDNYKAVVNPFCDDLNDGLH